jgi:hypothetical protein
MNLIASVDFNRELFRRYERRDDGRLVNFDAFVSNYLPGLDRYDALVSEGIKTFSVNGTSLRSRELNFTLVNG